MDTLVTVELNTQREVKTRKEVIDRFTNFFIKKELSSVQGAGSITKGDPIVFQGYFVSRFDLIEMLSDICSDITLDGVAFKDILKKTLQDQKVIDSSKNKVGIGIQFGYGLSREIPHNDPTKKIRMSQELQLVFDTLGKEKPDKPSKMIASYTTANIRAFDPPISIPNGGTPYPATVI